MDIVTHLNSKLFFALALLVLSSNAGAEQLEINCNNAKRLECAKQHLSIDDNNCSATSAYTHIIVDLVQLSLTKTGTPNATLPTTASETWLKDAQAGYSVCLALANEAVASSDSWSNQLLLGYMFQSDYDEEGANLGFKEQSGIAQIAFNGRWLYEDDTLLHWEIGGLLGKSAINTDDPESDNSENEDSTDADADMQAPQGITAFTDKPKFTDVDGSLDIYTKLTYSPTWALNGNQDSLSSYFTFGGLAGFKTRDVLTSDQDGVVAYAGLIGEFYYFGKNVKIGPNDIPRGRITFGPMYFEEYGGADDQLRWLLTGEWNLTGGNDGDVVVGIKANMGKGSDDIGVFAAVRKPLSSLSGFFGFGN